MWLKGKVRVEASKYAEVPRAKCSTGAGKSSRIQGRTTNEAFSTHPLEVFSAIARTSLESAHPFELLMELIGTTAIFSKHLVRRGSDLHLGKLKRVDYQRSVIAGQLGYALAALFMQQSSSSAPRGYTLFAHFEELSITPPTTPAPTRRPDMVALNPATRNIALLEAKGSFAQTGDIWSSKPAAVTKAYKEQICPWLGCCLEGQRIEKGFAVGARLTQEEAAHVKWISTKTSSPTSGNSYGPPATAIASASYARWLQKMGPQFWPLSFSLRYWRRFLPRGTVRLRIRELDGEAYVFGPGFMPFGDLRPWLLGLPYMYWEYLEYWESVFNPLWQAQRIAFGMSGRLFEKLLQYARLAPDNRRSAPADSLFFHTEASVRDSMENEQTASVKNPDGTAIMVVDEGLWGESELEEFEL